MNRTFEASPDTVPRARHTVMAALIDAGCGIATIETAALLTTELAANVVLHAKSERYQVDVDVDAGVDRVHVEITDLDERYPLRPLREPPDAESGRGLQLVESLSRRWGVRSLDGGKALWFEL